MRTLLLASSLALGACAGTDVARVANPAYGAGGKYTDEEADGIRYYESSPFLLVYSDGRGGLNSQLLFMPDLTKKRVVDPFAVLASNASTLTFTNGVLTQGKTVVDETVVPKATLGALTQVATALIKGTLNAAGQTPTAELPPPQLFKIVLGKDGSARLVGGGGVDAQGNPRPIEVTISSPDTPGAGAGAGGAGATKTEKEDSK
jgi:hypothetical protein